MDDGQLELIRQLLNGGAAMSQAHRHHSCAFHDFNYAANVFRGRRFRQRAQIQANGRAIKKVRRGGSLPRQLVEDLAGLGGAQSDLHDPHLTEADLHGLPTRGIGWLFHQETGFFKNRHWHPRPAVYRESAHQ